MLKIKISLCLNIIIVIFVAFATICMMNGIYFMGQELLLTETGPGLFKYFTVQSNVLMGIIALVFALAQSLVLTKKIKEIHKDFYVLKMVFTVGVVLTFLTTALFLAPTSTHGYFALFKNANLFYHFLIPLLSAITFVFFEKTDQIKFKYVCMGVLPMLLYGIYYTINIFSHIVDGKVLPEYDWYGFAAGGMYSIFISFPIMLIATYLISFTLWKFNKI
ncbi:MAG: Pr6Pr family membrane protein [Clostridia bacterium]|nr:Pr6Pr family membrane protein [Clostridia bacterium]